MGFPLMICFWLSNFVWRLLVNSFLGVDYNFVATMFNLYLKYSINFLDPICKLCFVYFSIFLVFNLSNLLLFLTTWWVQVTFGWKHGKVCQQGILDCFVENIHKLKFNTLNSWIFFISMINKRKFFNFIE